jgi:murein DD-endopeptidase MepM/ murein hydrolase activator NlpD
MNRRVVVAIVLLVASALIWVAGSKFNLDAFKHSAAKPKQDVLEASLAQEAPVEIAEPTLLYGLPVDSFAVVETTIKRGQNLASILLPYNIEARKSTELAVASKEVFDVRRLAANKKITLLCDKNDQKTAKYFVYEPNATEYVVFSVGDTLGAQLTQKEVLTEEKSIYGIINSSLSATVSSAGGNAALTSKLVDVFAWQIDFFHIQKGDNFKVIYEEKSVEGESIGVGNILAVEFEHNGQVFNAYRFEQGEDGAGYYDEEGNSLRKAFLKAPLNYTRISSRYTMKRFHPVQKRYKAHLGTDYAAPRGTPIYSVGDGIVVAAAYNRGNGNYVKVKHNGTYTTQYLHMSKRASGMRPGVRVKQGQVIGYVGSTGLATGPHLCFRFWKNGKQVDPFRVEMPASEPLDAKYVQAFEETKQQYSQKLAALDVEQEPLELHASL